MKIINYDPSVRIPPICEDEIHNHIIIGITTFERGNVIAIATKYNNHIVWLGGSSSDNTIRILSNSANSLLDLLIKDYNINSNRTRFIILESMADYIQFITDVFIANTAFNCMLENISNVLWRNS